MRDYEVVYIFRPTLEADQVDQKLDSFHQRLEGEISAVEHWGKRQLAFEIQGERNGYYVVAQFEAAPASLSEFEQGLKRDDDLIRHLVVLSEGELPIPPSQRGEDEEEKEDRKGREKAKGEESEEGEEAAAEEEEEEGEDEDEVDEEDEEETSDEDEEK